jgi:hypothetical protein
MLSSDRPLLFCVFRNIYAEKPVTLSKYLLYNIDSEVILFNTFFIWEKYDEYQTQMHNTFASCCPGSWVMSPFKPISPAE